MKSMKSMKRIANKHVLNKGSCAIMEHRNLANKRTGFPSALLNPHHSP